MTRVLRALTLIEVLIVVAIILVLAGLLLPVLQSSQMAAKQSKSMAQMKQIALAIGQYLDQHGDLPWSLWADVRPLNDYVKETSLWSAPDDPYKRGANPQASYKSGFRVSYYVPVTLDESFMKELASVPNHGILAALHLGESTRVNGPIYTPLYDHLGKYHLARLDGSVQLIARDIRCTSDKPHTPEASWWHIFAPGTDASDKVARSILGGAVFIPCQTRL